MITFFLFCLILLLHTTTTTTTTIFSSSSSSFLLFRLLSADPLGVRLPFTSGLPWLVVAPPRVAPPPPSPLVLTTRRFLLSSSRRTTSTSCHLEAPPAFKTLPPLCRLAPRLPLPLVCRLVVGTPLVTPPPPLDLSMLHRLLSADASPPVCLLFASWLSRCPCCCAAASSRSLDAPPPPRDAPPPLVHYSSRSPLVCGLVIMSHLVALPPPCVSFRRAAASRVHP
jgi:hypothetical protein